VFDGKWKQSLFEIANAVITFRDLDIENSFLDLDLGLTWSTPDLRDLCTANMLGVVIEIAIVR
jgi:hypothetical protein